MGPEAADALRHVYMSLAALTIALLVIGTLAYATLPGRKLLDREVRRFVRHLGIFAFAYAMLTVVAIMEGLRLMGETATWRLPFYIVAFGFGTGSLITVFAYVYSRLPRTSSQTRVELIEIQNDLMNRGD